jgi:hypothetical protein
VSRSVGSEWRKKVHDGARECIYNITDGWDGHSDDGDAGIEDWSFISAEVVLEQHDAARD